MLEMNALITASIFFKYHSALLLYVAYDNTSQSSINKVRPNSTNSNYFHCSIWSSMRLVLYC